MSFYKSLEQLKTKIDQKNIVLITGNVDEIFSFKKDKNDSKISSEIDKPYSIYEYLLENAKFDKYQNIQMYHSSKGIIDFSDSLQSNGNENYSNPQKDEFDDGLEEQSNKIPLNQYLKQITDSINSIDDLHKKHSCFYIIDCSEMYFDKNMSGAELTNLAELLSNFISFSKQSLQGFINNRKKLILISRFPEVINSIISSNNTEFVSISIQKPDFNERRDFFKRNSGLFNVKKSINDPEHADFKDAITITDGLSFREILQYSRIQNLDGDDELTFKQLYNIATFNKSNSDWEKFDFKKISEIDAILKERVKGQDYAIEAIKTTLKRTFTGLNGITYSNNSKKPKGILFFVGPTGTGKTELAKSLTEFIFGDENRMIRFDMSEYNHEHSDQRLIGSPPGYIGYDSGGQLTNAVKQKPFSVLLFDEIEKANGKIFDKFLQILEDGRLTSSQGEIIDFSETFIIFTSNIGTTTIAPNSDHEITRNEFIKAVKDHFANNLNRLEILNRIGEKNIIPFNFIMNSKIHEAIIKSKIERIQDNLKKEKMIRLRVSDANLNLLTSIISTRINLKFGGRGIVAELETVLIDELSNFIFENFDKFTDAKLKKEFLDIKLEIDDKKVVFDFS